MDDAELDNALFDIEQKIGALGKKPICKTRATAWDDLYDFRRQLAEVDSDLKALCGRI